MSTMISVIQIGKCETVKLHDLIEHRRSHGHYTRVINDVHVCAEIYVGSKLFVGLAITILPDKI